MKKKGFTLIEMVVAMGIFALLSTIIIGAYVVVLNMKALTSTMKENQQKMRTTIELISRLSRQADRVEVRDATGIVSSSNTVVLYFYSGTPNLSATRFVIGPIGGSSNPTTLYTQNCTSMSDQSCTSWESPDDLLGGTVDLETTSYFSISAAQVANIPTLSFKLNGKIKSMTDNPYYSNTFNIENSVILESL